MKLNLPENASPAILALQKSGPFAISFDIPPPPTSAKKDSLAKHWRSRRDHAAIRGKPQSDTSEVYVDGSSLTDPRTGGFAALIICPSGRRETLRGSAPGATNNQMELRATITALRALPLTAKAVVFSDSKYIVEGVNTWRPGWEAKGWRNSAKKPVENKGLWVELFALRDERPGVCFEWLKGHAGNRDHDYVDTIARAEAEKERQKAIGAEAESAG